MIKMRWLILVMALAGWGMTLFAQSPTGEWTLHGGTRFAGDLPTTQTVALSPIPPGAHVPWELPLEACDLWERQGPSTRNDFVATHQLELRDGSTLGVNQLALREETLRFTSSWGQVLSLPLASLRAITSLPGEDQRILPFPLRAADWQTFRPDTALLERGGHLQLPPGPDRRLAREIPRSQPFRIDLRLRSPRPRPGYTFQLHSRKPLGASPGMIQVSVFEDQIRIYQANVNAPPLERSFPQPSIVDGVYDFSLFSDPAQRRHELWINHLRLLQWEAPQADGDPGAWFNLLLEDSFPFIVERFHVTRWDGRPLVIPGEGELPAGQTRLSLANGDTMDAELLAIEENGLRIRLSGAEILLPGERVRGLDFGGLSRKSPLPVVTLSSGLDRLYLSPAAWTSETLRATSPLWPEPLLLPRAAVDTLDLPSLVGDTKAPFELKLLGGETFPVQPLHLTENSLRFRFAGTELEIDRKALSSLRSTGAAAPPPPVPALRIHTRHGAVLALESLRPSAEGYELRSLGGTSFPLAEKDVESLSLYAAEKPSWFSSLLPLSAWQTAHTLPGRVPLANNLTGTTFQNAGTFELRRPLPVSPFPYTTVLRFRSGQNLSLQINPFASQRTNALPGIVILNGSILMPGILRQPLQMPPPDAQGRSEIVIHTQPRTGAGSFRVNGVEIARWDTSLFPPDPALHITGFAQGFFLESLSCLPDLPAEILPDKKWLLWLAEEDPLPVESLRLEKDTLFAADRQIPLASLVYLQRLRPAEAPDPLSLQARVHLRTYGQLLPFTTLRATPEGLQGQIPSVNAPLTFPWQEIGLLEFLP